jgi:hypothetical protein
LQFTTRFAQFIASRSRGEVPLPTVRFIATNQTNGPTMKTISTQARIAAAFFAVVMSTVVLGGTVTGMQSASKSAEMPTIAMERVVITAPAAS